jgi:hypothetical protein
VRRSAAYGCCVWLAVLICASEVCAASLELHPGIITSYMYTDNYLGAAQDEQSESYYAIGPSLGFKYLTSSLSWDFYGYVAQEYHLRFEEDKHIESKVDTHALLTGQRQTLDLTYAYLDSIHRTTLDQAVGPYQSHAAELQYKYSLTPTTVMSLGYIRTMSYVQPPDEDVVSNSGSLGLNSQVTQRNRVELKSSYGYYLYEISPNVELIQGEGLWYYALSPQLEVGPDVGFEKHSPEGQPYQDVYYTRFAIAYGALANTKITAKAGQSWLHSETHENLYVNDGSLGINVETKSDKLQGEVFGGYRYEYTSYGAYGIYKTKAYDIMWEHKFIEELKSTFTSNITDRTPTTTNEERYKEISHRIELTYEPWKYVTCTASYLHLQTNYEISDTVRENRYRMTVEVRY